MSGNVVNNNLGATTAATSSSLHVNERAFNDYHFSCFLAMETPITIVPRFSLARVDCLGGLYGPFEPNYPIDVPTWLALHLRQTDTCTVSVPDYLRLPFLKEVLAKEQASDATFEALPFYFFEVAKLLCEGGGGGGGGGLGHGVGSRGAGASDDIPHVAEVLRLVGEIKSVRQRKLKQSMGVFEPEGSAMFLPGIGLTHIVCNEFHFLRTSFAVVLQQACEMENRRAHPMSYIAAASSPSSALAAGGAGRGGWGSEGARLPPVSLSAVTAARGRDSIGLSQSTITTATTTTTTPTPARGSALAGRAPSITSSSYTATTTDATTVMTTTAIVDDDDNNRGSTTEGGGGAEGVALTAAAAAPLAQPPAKKRRTLRQT